MCLGVARLIVGEMAYRRAMYVGIAIGMVVDWKLLGVGSIKFHLTTSSGRGSPSIGASIGAPPVGLKAGKKEHLNPLA